MMQRSPSTNHPLPTTYRILVTGCAGFIGWKVTEFALQDGHLVTGVDNLNETYDVRLKMWRLRCLSAESRNFKFHKLDIADAAALAKLFEEESDSSPFDAVINLAARAGVRSSILDPWAYYETNTIGTLNLLEQCRKSGVRKFILASTSSLYGARNPRPFREDANTDASLSPYAASKKAAEVLTHVYHYLYDLDVTILRYFTVYGPAGRPDMSIFRFIRWIAEGEPVVIYGDGLQERDFTYVDDIARGTLAALHYLTTHHKPQTTNHSPQTTNSPPPPIYQIINLGSDRPVPLNRVISILEELLGKKAKVVHKPAHPADVPATWADISRARELLGWEPKISLEEGLKNAVDWYIANRSWAKEVKIL